MTRPDITSELLHLTTQLREVNSYGREVEAQILKEESFHTEHERQRLIWCALEEIKAQVYPLISLSKSIHNKLIKPTGPIELCAFTISEQISILARIPQNFGDDQRGAGSRDLLLFRKLRPRAYQQKRSKVMIDTLYIATDIVWTLYTLSGLLYMQLSGDSKERSLASRERMFTQFVIDVISYTPRREWNLAYQSKAYWNFRRLRQMLLENM